MIALFMYTALAQEPMTFDPMPADIKIDGKTYSGILVDEATFVELGELRVLKQENAAKLEALNDWKAWADTHYSQEFDDLRGAYELSSTRLTEHYEAALTTERRRNFWQKQAFSLGVAAGLVGATGIYLGATHFYGNVLTVDLTAP